MEIPATSLVAIGAVLAALIAGFFSVLGLVASKENKVSEFRLAWIDGLREEIASYTVGIKVLVRLHQLLPQVDKVGIESDEKFRREIEWAKASSGAYDRATGSLSKILLRLNPAHSSDSKHPEFQLREAVVRAQTLFNDGDFEAADDCCKAIRDCAAPLLKSTWNLVKKGEVAYRVVRWGAIIAFVVAAVSFSLLVVAAVLSYLPAA